MTIRSLTLLLAALSMLGPFATDSYLPALPSVGQQFGTSAETTQLTLSVYLFGYAFMTLFFGMLSDSFGRRRVIVAGLAMFTLASVGATLAPDLPALLAFRSMQGLSAGAGIVVGQAIVRDTLSGHAIQRTLAHMMMVFAIAPAIAPIVGAQLNDYLGWRSIFGLLALFSAVLLFTCVRWLPESLAVAHRQPFQAGTIAHAYIRALRHRRFMCGALANGCLFGGLALYISCAADFVMHMLHRRDTDFAWLFVPMIAGVVGGSAYSARRALLRSPSSTIRLGLGVTGLAAGTNLIYSAHFTLAVPWAVIPICLYAFGMALAMPALSNVTQAQLPEMRGMAASLQSFVQMFIFALISGLAPIWVFDKPVALAVALASAVTSAVFFWLAAKYATRETSDAHGSERHLAVDERAEPSERSAVKQPYACGQECTRQFRHDTF